MYVAESKRLTHQGAKKIMTTAVDMASQAGIAISCAIVDAGGHMILLERMDGGRFHTVHSCTTKAVCAASNRRPTTGVPPEVIARLADALDKALDDSVVRETLTKLGGSLPAKAERSPAAFDRFVRSEIARWAPILAAAGAENNAMATGSTGTRR